jgi:[ribosomal protein S18]-alanine N-acetyltransferase
MASARRGCGRFGHNTRSESSGPTVPPDPCIRRAGPRDLSALVAIEAAAFEPARRSSRASLRRALGSRFQRVFVFDIDGDVAGLIVLWPYRHSWRVYNLASDPSHRNRGVAGALLSESIELARRAGARTLVLESRDEPGLVRFYERRGFAVRRRLPDYYGRGQHAVRMARPLAA